jgi:hypothetical protein
LLSKCNGARSHGTRTYGSSKKDNSRPVSTVSILFSSTKKRPAIFDESVDDESKQWVIFSVLLPRAAGLTYSYAVLVIVFSVFCPGARADAPVFTLIGSNWHQMTPSPGPFQIVFPLSPGAFAQFPGASPGFYPNLGPRTCLSSFQNQVPGGCKSAVVRATIDALLASLTSVGLKENVSRFSRAGGVVHKLDSFETEISIFDGMEHYIGVKGRHRTYQHVSQIGGLWSFGEVVTMLRTTRDIIKSSSANQDMSGCGGGSAQAEIRFQSPSANHQWFLTVGGRIYWLDIQGAICVSGKTGEIERLIWSSASGPSEASIASILWVVNFRAANFAGSQSTMPSDSIFRVVRRGLGQEAEWNLTRYAVLGRYGSRVRVHYGP